MAYGRNTYRRNTYTAIKQEDIKVISYGRNTYTT